MQIAKELIKVSRILKNLEPSLQEFSDAEPDFGPSDQQIDATGSPAGGAYPSFTGNTGQWTKSGLQNLVKSKKYHMFQKKFSLNVEQGSLRNIVEPTPFETRKIPQKASPEVRPGLGSSFGAHSSPKPRIAAVPEESREAQSPLNNFD